VTAESGQVLRILNFVNTSSPPGWADVTINAVTTHIMQPVPYTIPETHIQLNLAGPLTLTVNPAPGNLTISYKVDTNR